MTDQFPQRPEIIQSETLIPKGKVMDVEGMRIVWSIAISVIALTIATAFLLIGLIYNKSDVITWATSLISAIAGAAISYGFNSRGK